jgi:CBS-domain-containing membrane protein
MSKLVKELMTKKFVAVHEIDSIFETVGKIAKSKETTLACVVDADGKLRGILTPKEVLKSVEVCEYGKTGHSFFSGMETLRMMSAGEVGDIMGSPASVKPDDEIQKAIDIMIDRGFYEVPVVDKKGRVIGAVNYLHIIAGSVDHCSSLQ